LIPSRLASLAPQDEMCGYGFRPSFALGWSDARYWPGLVAFGEGGASAVPRPPGSLGCAAAGGRRIALHLALALLVLHFGAVRGHAIHDAQQHGDDHTRDRPFASCARAPLVQEWIRLRAGFRCRIANVIAIVGRHEKSSWQENPARGAMFREPAPQTVNRDIVSTSGI